MMRKFLILVALLALVTSMGCSDDATNPEAAPFAVNLTVTDPAGQPVAGLEATLHVFIPEWLVPSAAKPRTILPLSLPVASDVSLIIYDLDGNVVNELFSGIKPPGSYQVAFAVDGEGNRLVGTHLYRCVMVASVENVEQFRGELFMTLYTSIDRQQRPMMGTTNAQGKLSYGVRTEFPYLYEPGPQMGYNENGEVRGVFEFIDKVQITLADPGSGLSLNGDVVIGQGRNTVNLVWDPKQAGRLPDAGRQVGSAAAGVEFVKVSEPTDKYTFGPGYPNPFN